MRHLVLAILLLLAAAPANAMAAGWSDPAVVGGRISSPVSVGVGDDGSAVALWQSQSDLFAAVRGAGAPFGAPVKVASNAGSPVLAVGDSGDAVAVWRDKRTNSLRAIAKQAGVTSFGEPAAFSGTGARSPDAAVDKFGSAIVVWSAAGSIYYSERGSDTPFSQPAKLGGGTSPSVALSDTTNAVVAWVRNGKIVSRTRGGGGEGFEAAQTLSLGGQRSANPEAAIAPDGHTLVTWAAVSTKPRVRQVLAYDSRTQNDQVLSTRGRFAGNPVVAIGGDGFGSVAWAENRRSDLTGRSAALVSRQDGEGVFKAHGKRISMTGDADPPRIDAGSRGDTVVTAREQANDEFGDAWISAAVAPPGATRFGKSVKASGAGDVYSEGEVGVDATGAAVLAWAANPGLTGVIQVVSAFYTP